MKDEDKPRLSTEGMKSAPVADVTCLTLRLEDGHIVFENKCETDIHIELVEVKYYVVGLPFTRAVRESEERRIRRLITEHIRVNITLKPRQEHRLFFGAVENIVEVYAIITIENRRIRIRLK